MKQTVVRVAVIGVVISLFGAVSMVYAETKSPPAGSSFEQRLVQRKKEQGIKLEERDKSRLQQRCSKAQTTIQALQQQLTEPINNRNRQYAGIDAKVWIGVGQLKLAGQDTFNLEKHHTAFNKQRAHFEKLTAEYTQTLDDAVLINCEADPVGFLALIETARDYLKQIRGQSELLRKTTVDNIKPELSNLGAKL